MTAIHIDNKHNPMMIAMLVSSESSDAWNVNRSNFNKYCLTGQIKTDVRDGRIALIP